MVFENFNPELQKIIKKRFKGPTVPQKLAIPEILAKNNILLLAQTGTGKTESAMLPIFHFLMQERLKPISALYITPLKSLNRDLLDRLLWWGNETGLELSVRHGDTSAYERKLQLEFPPNMLITTLETLQPLLTAKRFRDHLRNIRYVIIDEVHETVNSKRGVQLTIGLERLKELCGDFQLIMLSATVGEPEKVAEFFAGGKKVNIIHAETTKQFDINVINPEPEPEDEKIAKMVYTSKEIAARLRTIMELIKGSRSTLTFTNTREFAEILASRIKTIDRTFPAEIHHSSLSKEVRIQAEKNFKSEKLKSLISTSSLQLGIDIGSVDLVLQYMSPRTVSQLIQRVGRSGHELQKISKGIIISTDEDDIFEAAVIARKALNREVEPTRFHEKAYDVLAHQIIGMTFDFGKTQMEKIFNVVKRARPYRDLTYKEFMEVCKQLDRLGLVFLEDTINKKRRGFDYYFTQLSTIPDVKQYKVFNIINQGFVGVLDEEFIALHGEPNTTFILKGESYKIISIEEDRVMVEPAQDIEASVPGWEGELIPVPYEVAQEVGKVRQMIRNYLKKKTEREAAKDVMGVYPVDRNSADKMVSLIKKQEKFGVIPSDKNILIEDVEDIVVIHSCFGSKVNETIGRFITTMLANRIGSVTLKTDPYRIMIQFQQKNLDLIKEILFQSNLEHFSSYVEIGLAKSELYEWKFVHVAKRFGAIQRNAEYGKIRMKKIIEDFSGTPIYQETLKELETEKLDIERALEVMKKIQSKEISVVFKEGLSPIGKIGVSHKYAEVIGPEKPNIEIFNLFKQRITNSQMRLVCVNCGKWSRLYTVKDVPEKLKCGNCDAKLLAPLKPNWVEALKVVEKGLKKERLDEIERAKFERAKKRAELFLVYGKKATIVLAARGVGPTIAKRILARFHKNEEDLFKDMLQAERQFVKTKQFWSA